MSLQVWLPLNGNLNNQGISDLKFSTVDTSTSSNSSGKIGYCYYNSSNSAGGIVSDKTISLGNKQTMLCWVKFTSLMSDSSLGGSMCGQHRYSSNTGLGLTIKYVSSTTGYLSMNTGTGSSRTYNTYCGSTLLSANTWYHVGFTYDGNIAKFYVNGKLDGTSTIGTMSVPTDYIQVFTWSFASTTGSSLHGNYKLYGYLNDVRIYDECLDCKAIKEISKGLVLHYPLNQSEKNPNLSVQASLAPPLPNSAGTSAYTVSVNNDYTRITCTAAGTGGRYNTCFSNDYRTASTTYTWSAYVRASRALSGITIGLEGNGTTTFDITTEWKKVGMTATLSTDTYSAFILYPYSNASVGDWIDIKMIKVEQGSISTPWCPCSADTTKWDSTAEYDVSGHNYNGTVVGGPLLSSGNQRYKVCYYFNSTSKYIILPTISFSGFANSYTFSWWGNVPSYEGVMFWGFSDGNRLNYYSGYYNNTGDSGNNPFYSSGTTTISRPSVNTWHHFALVGNGSSSLLYLDGSLYGTAKAYVSLTGTKIYINGWDSGTSYKTNGYISDFRIYSTALSASDIKELYNTPISVSNNGTILTHGEFVEE